MVKEDMSEDLSSCELRELTDRYKSMTSIKPSSLRQSHFKKINKINKLIAACTHLQMASKDEETDRYMYEDQSNSLPTQITTNLDQSKVQPLNTSREYNVASTVVTNRYRELEMATERKNLSVLRDDSHEISDNFYQKKQS